MNVESEAFAAQKRSLGDLLGDGLGLLFRHALPLLGIAALAYIPINLVSGWATTEWMSDLTSWSTELEQGGDAEALAEDALQSTMLPLFMFLIYMPSLLLLSALSGLMLAGMSLAVRAGRTQGLIGQGFNTLRRFFAYVAMLFVEYTIVFLVSLPFLCGAVALLVGGIFALEEGGPSNPSEMLALVLIAIPIALLLFVLLAIPTFYLAARWIAAIPALIDEDLGPLEALRRSWQLTRAQKGRSVLLVIALQIIAVFVLTGFAILGSTVGIVPVPGSSVLGSALTALGSVFYHPFSVMVYVLFYDDLRAREAGPDTPTDFEAERLSSEPDPSPGPSDLEM